MVNTPRQSEARRTSRNCGKRKAAPAAVQRKNPRRKAGGNGSAAGAFPPRILLIVLVGIIVGGVRLLAGALERGAENVAERRAGIRGAVLGNRLLLLGDF